MGSKRITYIARAKSNARYLTKSPLCGNNFDSPSIDKAIAYVEQMKFYESQGEYIYPKKVRYWKRVLKELYIMKKQKSKEMKGEEDEVKRP